MRIVDAARMFAPNDTGNLADNAIKYEFLDSNTARIYVDEAIAPYMPYTNEPWVSSWWNGRQNPNLYWFDTLAEYVIMMIANETGAYKNAATVSRNEYNFADVNLLDMEQKYQNKTGDYTAYDAYYHSSYLSETHIPLSQWVDAVRGKYGG